MFLAVFGATTVVAQGPTVREEAQIYGRPGWVLENGTLRVGLLRGGGHIAEVRLLSANPRLSINPMFIPLGNGYMGHLVCFPYYGPASADERAQGLRGHGEAGSVEWQQTRAAEIDAQHITFYYGADLPVTHYRSSAPSPSRRARRAYMSKSGLSTSPPTTVRTTAISTRPLARLS